MRKIVLTFGLISGAVLVAMFLVTLPFHNRIGNDVGMIIGYTTMVAASLLIYFGVRRYRDTAAGGRVSFARALVVGLLIGAVSGVCYTAAWEVIYFGGFAPNFIAKYQAGELAKARAHGATAAQLEQMRAEQARMAESYKNPVVNAAMTFMEPLPVTVLVSLLSAGLLSRRPRRREEGGAELVGVA